MVKALLDEFKAKKGDSVIQMAVQVECS